MKKVASVFIVSNYFKPQEKLEITVEGTGSSTLRALRKDYPSSRYKHVLDGFEINGDYKPLNLGR